MNKRKEEVLSWLGKTAKLLFIFLFFSFSFWTYYTGRSMGECHNSHCHMINHMMGVGK